MSFNQLASRVRMAALALFASGLVLVSPVAAQNSQGGEPPADLPEGSVGGMGDVNLYPKRVVIDGRRSIATIGLYNRTLDDGDYEIDVIDMIMMPDGRLVDIDEKVSAADRERVKTAKSFLRYSPRRVTLRGSESQTVRMMARAGSDLPPGEYRSHFLVRSVPRDSDAGFSIENAVDRTNPDTIGITIRPRFGISIPVIVRIGDTTLDVSVTDARVLTMPDGRKAIGITFNRTGTRSAFGNIAVTARGSDVPVAAIKGIGIYPEISERKVLLPVNPELDPQYLASGRTLQISYIDDDFEPGATLVEHTITVP